MTLLLMKYLPIAILYFTSFRKLRSSVNGQLLVNLCFAMLGLFVVFIISAQKQNGLTTAGCGFFAAVLHYFLLAYFFFTAAEALFLYFKLVKVFMGQSFFIRNYISIAMLLAWSKCSYYVISLNIFLTILVT